MVRKWSNQNLPGALHYITANFLDRQRVLIEERYFKAFIEPCAKSLRDWPCRLIAYALMPDHIHMIVNPRDGRIKEFTGKLKAFALSRLSACHRLGNSKSMIKVSIKCGRKVSRPFLYGAPG